LHSEFSFIQERNPKAVSARLHDDVSSYGVWSFCSQMLILNPQICSFSNATEESQGILSVVFLNVVSEDDKTGEKRMNNN